MKVWTKTSSFFGGLIATRVVNKECRPLAAKPSSLGVGRGFLPKTSVGVQWQATRWVDEGKFVSGVWSSMEFRSFSV